MRRWYLRSYLSYPRPGKGGRLAWWKHWLKPKSTRPQRQSAALSRPTSLYRQSQRTGGWRRYGLVSVIICLSWGILLIYLPFFKISREVFLGTTAIPPAELAAALQNYFAKTKFIFPARNFFLVSEPALARYLTNKFHVQVASVKKTFPHTISVTITDKVLTVLYVSGANAYLLDKAGQVGRTFTATTTPPTADSLPFPLNNLSAQAFARLDNVSTSSPSTTLPHSWPDKLIFNSLIWQDIYNQYQSLPLLYDTRLKDVKIEEVVLAPETIKALLNFSEKWRQSLPQFIISAYLIGERPRTVLAALTNAPWYLLFNPNEAIDIQVENAALLLKEYTPSEYLDLRLEERVYWR